MVRYRSLARNVTTNAVVGWLLVGVVAMTSTASLLVESLLGGLLSLVAAAVLVLPAALRRDWRVMLPWPLALVVAAASVTRSLGVVPEVAGYVVVSAVALAVVVELDAFTEVEMSRRFAVLFALLTTLAFQTWWTVVQYVADRWFGTGFVRSQVELQWDLVAVTVVTLVMSGLFLWYFDHVDHVGSRNRPVVPEEAR